MMLSQALENLGCKVYVCVCVRAFACMWAYMYVCVCVCVKRNAYVYPQAWMLTIKCMSGALTKTHSFGERYIITFAHIHAQTHTYIHTHTHVIIFLFNFAKQMAGCVDWFRPFTRVTQGYVVSYLSFCCIMHVCVYMCASCIWSGE